MSPGFEQEQRLCLGENFPPEAGSPRSYQCQSRWVHALSAQAARGFAYLLVVQRGHALRAELLGHFGPIGSLDLVSWANVVVQVGHVCGPVWATCV